MLKEFSEGAEPRWASMNSRRPEFQLLNPIAGVSPTPFLMRFESSTGVLFAIPANSKIIGDRYIMNTRPVLIEK
jgi:hypothetical protein